ncbi:hypothetical protein M427DRAFT_70441, partial [Gonapodya prolifera JEL478]
MDSSCFASLAGWVLRARVPYVPTSRREIEVEPGDEVQVTHWDSDRAICRVKNLRTGKTGWIPLVNDIFDLEVAMAVIPYARNRTFKVCLQGKSLSPSDIEQLNAVIDMDDSDLTHLWLKSVNPEVLESITASLAECGKLM